MIRPTILVGVVVTAALLLGGAAYWSLQSGERPVEASLSVAELLGNADTVGYARAVQPVRFEFPQDYGAHDGFKTEWWYVTGNLQSASGRHFGYQLTFFRSALVPLQSALHNSEPPTLLCGDNQTVGLAEGAATRSITSSITSSNKASANWATRHLYMAHFAVSDVQAKQFYAFERFSREAQQLAGAELTPRFRVWLEDWALESLSQPNQHQTMKQTTFPLRVRANNGNVELSLTLDSIKPVVLQGTNGLSQKGTGVGNASYYYSLTRLLTQGTIRIGGEEFAVSGTSWIDREWSTSALDKGQVGWDWFALHLNDAAAPAGTPTGQELMFYQLRKRDGSADSTSKGVLVRSDGSVRVLQVADISISVETTWQHPVSQIRYPAAWRLQVPSEALDVRVTPHLADQELNVSVRYWEGAVKVVGKQGTKALAGNGYVELTGYGEQRGEQRGEQCGEQRSEQRAKPTP